MKKIELKSRKWLRAIFGCISLSAIAFVFQACYGTPNDLGNDVKVSGTVKSKATNSPIKGIKVSRPGSPTYEITDEKGNFSFYTFIDGYGESPDTTYQYHPDSIPVLFADIDSIENGYFADKMVIIAAAGKKEVKIDVELDNKQ